MKTIKEICEEFFKLETEYNFNNIKIQDTYPWELVRVYLYYEITRKLGIFGSAQQSSVSLFDKIKSFAPFIKNSILSNPFSGKNDIDVLVFSHPRKVFYNNQYQDIYSYFLSNNFTELNKSYCVIDSPYLNKHYIKSNNHVKFNDRILLSSYFYKKRNKIAFTDEELENINFIKTKIKESFNVDVDLFNIFSNHILNFKYEYCKYKELLDEKNVKQVYVVVAYENKALISACKDLGVEVLELQHGVISKYHLGYSFPDSNVHYFPDKILSFGDYWEESVSYPISLENIFPIGFKYFEENSKMYKNIPKIKNQILFISQGVIGEYLSNFAFDLFKKLDENYTFVYKLHPGEYETWRENYPVLSKLIKYDNFKLIDNNEIPLYKLFAESEFQVGAFSTAIYEGLSFNCKTFILDVPGVEYLDDLVEKNIVIKINDSDDMVDKLNDNLVNYDSEYFFKDFDSQLLEDIIVNENIMRIVDD